MSERPVRKERSGWRDEALSRKHRDDWGYNCPAVDIDFLMVEYDQAKAVALVEYKHEGAMPVFIKTNTSVKALRDLGDKANIPVFIVRYAGNFSWFRVQPINAVARQYLPNRTEMTEQEYVSLLYKLRGRADYLLSNRNAA